jgi:NAD(P)-dependent dehydrogenase (short-subunit alcohol dehydrogenase family)
VVIGASSGIGRAIALGFARHGAHVVPTARRASCVECVCRDVLGLGRRTLMHLTDVTSRASVESLRDAVLGEFGGVDILVNAAGLTIKQPTMDSSDDDWHRVMDTNVSGVLRTSVAFHDALAASGHGRIVNIASLGSFLAFHQVAAYCASKAAVASLTRNLACEWAKHGILVNAIAPGVFPTELNGEIITGTPRGEEILQRTPLGRFGDPEELVGVAVLLASDGASFLTGQTIAVDGGYLASGVNS